MTTLDAIRVTAASVTPVWLPWLTGLGALTALATLLLARAAERRRYAGLVSALTGPHVHDCPAVANIAEGEWSGHHFHTVIVENGSELPVRDVVVSLNAPYADLLPEERPEVFIAVGAVPAKDKREVEIGHIGQLDPQFPTLVEVHFTDVRGRSWHRDTLGKLRRSRERPGARWRGRNRGAV
ncbi:hypothetical protein GCM10010331_44790 [Streptomyces xanthochromogenes]|uniref:hypothetical protein n=1 Tax=Streptomyces xanthochromogenes TaxID=67384 RepID=UPI001675C603|nr:hypothetical protein [Streptomyces xanthochromogenes]GHB52246.1 hypothetical protein GCM10010331_44790 [Streptomyces xanthochromogenes]